MTSLLQEIFNPECILCGSLLRQQHLFCKKCFLNRLEPEMFLKKQILNLNQRSIKHYYLFDWVDTDDHLFYRLSHQMKSLRGKQALQFYTKWLLNLIYNENEIQFFETRLKLIVPAPGSTIFSVHSLFMAEQALKMLNHSHIWNGLHKNEKTAQKFINRESRQRVLVKIKTDFEVQLLEFITNLDKAQGHLILIDDVVTTGSTLEACLKAIGWHEPVLAISIFYRKQILQ